MALALAKGSWGPRTRSRYEGPCLECQPHRASPSQQYLHVFLNEVTVLVPVLNEAKHSFALYTPERTRQRWPVRLAAATEQDMNDWVSDGVQ